MWSLLLRGRGGAGGLWRAFCPGPAPLHHQPSQGGAHCGPQSPGKCESPEEPDHGHSGTHPHPHHVHCELAQDRPGFDRGEPFCSRYTETFFLLLACAEAEADTPDDLRLVTEVL